MTISGFAKYLGVAKETAKKMTEEDDFPNGVRLHFKSPLSWWKSDLDAWIISRGLRVSSSKVED